MKTSIKLNRIPTSTVRSKSLCRPRELEKAKTVPPLYSFNRNSIILSLKIRNPAELMKSTEKIRDIKQTSNMLLEKKMQIEQEIENILGIEPISENSTRDINMFLRNESEAFKNFRQIRKSMLYPYSIRQRHSKLLY